MRKHPRGKNPAVNVAAWKPGTSRWAYLNTSVYLAGLAVMLPLAIAVNAAWGWVLFSIIMLSGTGNITAAWLMRRHARHATSVSGAAPPPPDHLRSRA
jgi:hypothetical protein